MNNSDKIRASESFLALTVKQQNLVLAYARTPEELSEKLKSAGIHPDLPLHQHLVVGKKLQIPTEPPSAAERAIRRMQSMPTELLDFAEAHPTVMKMIVDAELKK